MASFSIYEYVQALRSFLRKSLRRPKCKVDKDDNRTGPASQGPHAWLWTWKWPQQNAFIRIPVFIFSILLVAILFVKLFSFSAPERISTTRPQYLSLLIAASDQNDVEVCKTILSAQVLNYPVPDLIQWGNTSDGKPVRKRDRTSNRLYHMHKHLQELPEPAQDGITILLESPNTWFQLRPDVLLRRYVEMTRIANQRLRKKYRWDATQKVIFASRTGCRSNITMLACNIASECRRRQGRKSHCLGQGAIIGKARDVRAILERAQSKLQLNPTGDLWEIFNEIYEQQEYQREFLRRLLSTSTVVRWAQKLHVSKPTSTDTIPIPSTGRMSLEDIRDIQFDFGIGLDYSSQLGSAMTNNDADWKTSKDLAEDIQASIPPFWTVSGTEPGLPKTAGWRDIELFSLKGTGITPPMLFRHPQPHGHEEAATSGELWTRLWLSQFSRDLYSAAERLPATAVASIVDSTGSEQIFWNRQITHNKAGAWGASGNWLHWQDMCGADHQWKEIFRDSAGGWKRTEWY